jgi:hypothetical protein
MVTDFSGEPVASIIYPEDGGSMFLRNVSEYLRDYTASHPRRQYSSLYYDYHFA